MIVLQGAKEQVDVLQFSPDGRSLVVPYPGGVQVWDELAAGRPPTVVLGHRGAWSARFTPDGRKLLLGGARVVVHDLATGQATDLAALSPSLRQCFCDLSPDARLLVAAQAWPSWMGPYLLFCRPLADLACDIWSVETDRPICTPPVFLGGGERFVVFEGRPDSVPHWTVTRDTRTGQVLSKVASGGYLFHSPVLSADRRLIAARWYTWIEVFQADRLDAKPVEIGNDNRREFTGLAFHPSGRYLAATSDDATVKLYDTSTWKMAQAFDWDIGRLRSVAFSPDGTLAAAGGDKGKIVVWDVDL